MTAPLFYSFVGSLLICMALIPPLMSSAGRLNVLDMPGQRKLHPVPIARVGGIAFALGTFVVLLLWAPKDEGVPAYLLGAALILLFGVWDDRVGFSFRTKFLGQLLAAGIAVWFGGVRLNTLPLAPDLTLPDAVAVPLTIVVLLGVTNAINLVDGLDGLAGGLAVLSFSGITYLAYLSSDTVVLFLMVSVMGGLLGFLRFNTYPARVFMGDGGSQFLGFLLGLSALLVTDPLRGPYTPALGLLIIGLPLLDTVGVALQRLAERRSPFVADNNHVHHKLLALGFLQHEAVLAIYAFQALMVSAACALRWQPDGLLLGLYGILGLVVLGLFAYKRRARMSRPGVGPLPALRGALLQRLELSERLAGIPLRVLRGGLLLFLSVGFLLAPSVPKDFGWLALALALGLAVGLKLAPEARPWLIRAALYVGSAFVLFLAEGGPSPRAWHVSEALNVLCGTVAVLVIVAARFGRGNRFQTTPLDYLMVFLAVVIPSLPELQIGATVVNFLIAKLIALFFAYELLLNAASTRLKPLALLSLWLLVGLGIRGLL
jgi:UDP-GlcNAc:undecaprenyl-phosphate GlcNAc-1-phosphate transferase